MGAKGAVAVTRPGPGRPVPSGGPPSPRGGCKGLWGPRRGGGRDCVGVGRVLLCVPCPVTGQSSWPHRRRPVARPRFLFQRQPGRGPSIPRGAGPAAGRGYRATWASRACRALRRSGRAADVPAGSWPPGQRGEGTFIAFVPFPREAAQEPEARGRGLAVAIQCADGIDVPGVSWFSLRLQSKVGSQLSKLSQTPPPDCWVLILSSQCHWLGLLRQSWL